MSAPYRDHLHAVISSHSPALPWTSNMARRFTCTLVSPVIRHAEFLLNELKWPSLFP